jgi:hypothetical protein
MPAGFLSDGFYCPRTQRPGCCEELCRGTPLGRIVMPWNDSADDVTVRGMSGAIHEALLPTIRRPRLFFTFFMGVLH